MEKYYYGSYPESGDSSPRSREIELENPPPPPPSPWDQDKVKFMCSYGGKIQPRSHDNQLSYIGGHTKILSVDRSVKFPSILSRLSFISGDPDVSFKYQLPGEDLDALISVSDDHDLDHMMHEYDRLFRATAKHARMRLFLFSSPKSNADFLFGPPPVHQEAEIQRQLHTVGGGAMYRRKSDDEFTGSYAPPLPADYYVPPPVNLAPSPVSSSGGNQYSATTEQQLMYMIQAQGGVYHAPVQRHVMGQGFYMAHNVPTSQPQPNASGGIGMMTEAGAYNAQVAYDNAAGRHVYYSALQPQPQYQGSGRR